MATIPSTYSTVFWNPDAPLYKTSNQANANGTDVAYTMQDLIDTVAFVGGGIVSTPPNSDFVIPLWASAGVSLKDSDIARTQVYSAPNGGQYELRGNMKIFGEASGSGVAALFIEDSLGAKLQVRDVDNTTGAINSEFAIESSDNFVSIGTTVSSTVGKIIVSIKGNGKFTFDTYTDSAGTEFNSFAPTSNFGCTLGAPTPSAAWTRVFFNLDEYADDAAAIAGGIVSGELYQTDGTGSAPLNVAGIVMVAQ
jgi:hypothetical protein